MGKQTTLGVDVAPTHDHVLVRRILNDAVSAGGIVIPDSARDDKAYRAKGEILAVGPGRIDPTTGYLYRPQSKVGQVVLYHQYPSPCLLGGGLEIIPEKQIVGVCK